METVLPKGAYAYSVEAREIETGQSARSRHPLPDPPVGGLTISDLVLLPAGPTTPVRREVGFRPFGSLLLDRSQEVAMYLEIHGLTPGEAGRVRYRLDLRTAEGRLGESPGSTLSWTSEGPSSESLPLTVTLGRLPVGKGVHRLILTVTDLVTGAAATTGRVVKVR